MILPLEPTYSTGTHRESLGFTWNAVCDFTTVSQPAVYVEIRTFEATVCHIQRVDRLSSAPAILVLFGWSFSELAARASAMSRLWERGHPGWMGPKHREVYNANATAACTSQYKHGCSLDIRGPEGSVGLPQKGAAP